VSGGDDVPDLMAALKCGHKPCSCAYTFGRLEESKGRVHRLVEGVRMWRVDHAPGDPLTLYSATPDPSLTVADVDCKVCLKRSEAQR